MSDCVHGGGIYSRPTLQPDDGSAIVHALAKCDHYSWCAGLLADNLTMTRESWHDGTYSHGWGSSAVVGVSWGVLGGARQVAAVRACRPFPSRAWLLPSLPPPPPTGSARARACLGVLRRQAQARPALQRLRRRAHE